MNDALSIIFDEAFHLVTRKGLGSIVKVGGANVLTWPTFSETKALLPTFQQTLL